MLDRFIGLRRSCCNGGRSKTRFIRENSTRHPFLDSHFDRCSCETSHGCSPCKSTRKDRFQGWKQLVQMQGNDRDSRKDIGSSHKRNHFFRDFGNPVNPSKDDGRNHQSNHYTSHFWSCSKTGLKGSRNGINLGHGSDPKEGYQHSCNRKENSQWSPLLSHPVKNVVHRTT